MFTVLNYYHSKLFNISPLILSLILIQVLSLEIHPNEQYLIKSIVTSSSKLSKCSLILWSNSVDKLPSEKSNEILYLTSSSMIFSNETLSFLILPNIVPKLHEHCSLVLYFYLSNFNNPLILPSNWESSLPGGYQRTFHVIFHKIQKPTELAGIMPLSLPIKLMLHQLFVISISNSSSSKLPTFDLFYSDIWGQLHTISQKIGINNTEYFQPKPKQNFLGKPFIFAFTDGGYISQKGIDSYLLHRKPLHLYISPICEISESLNATPSIRLIKSTNFGFYDEQTKKWTGVIGQVVNGRAHITQALLITKERNEVLIPSVTIDSDGLTFLTGLPMRAVGSASFLLKTFELRILITQTALILAIILILKLIKCNKRPSNRSDLISIIGYVLKPIAEQTEDSVKYRDLMKENASRLLLSPWLFSTILLISVFKTNLISRMTHPAILYPPQDFNSLIKSDEYMINFLARNETTAGYIFKSLKDQSNAIVMALDKRIIGDYHSTTTTCITQTQEGNKVCLGVHTLLMIKSIVSLTQENGKPMYRISPNYLVSSGFVFGIRKDLPHLKGQIDKMMFHYGESGSYQHYTRQWIRDLTSIGKKLAKVRRATSTLYPIEEEALKESQTSSRYGTINAMIAMFPLLLGYVVAIILVIIEVFVAAVKKYKNKKFIYSNKITVTTIP